MNELEQAERDVATARAALSGVLDRYYRGLAGASAVADAEVRLDRALDALGMPPVTGADLDGMDALEAAYHEGAQ